MGCKLTNSQFIEKSKLVHGDLYDYSLVEYVRWDKKVKLKCPHHNIFEQTPNGHLSGRGCRKCGSEKIGIHNSLSEADFLNKAKIKHGNRFNYSKVVYTNRTSSVIILCEIHGEISITPEVHLRTCGCSECGEITRRNNIKKNSSDQFKKFTEVHGDRYDLSKTEYVDSSTKIIATCRIHGDFTKNVTDFLNGGGCQICGNSTKSQHKVLTTEQFKEKAKLVHGNRYDYSKSIYIKSNIELEIGCKVEGHASFKQKANAHLSGRGCQKCAELWILENHNGWGYKEWVKCAKKSKNFESFKVYIVRCFNEDEEFYKIGKTFTTVETRFKGKREMPYNYELIKYIIFNNGLDASKKEEELKAYSKEYQYTPRLEFAGRRECFNLQLPIQEIINL